MPTCHPRLVHVVYKTFFSLRTRPDQLLFFLPFFFTHTQSLAKQTLTYQSISLVISNLK